MSEYGTGEGCRHGLVWGACEVCDLRELLRRAEAARDAALAEVERHNGCMEDAGRDFDKALEQTLDRAEAAEASLAAALKERDEARRWSTEQQNRWRSAEARGDRMAEALRVAETALAVGWKAQAIRWFEQLGEVTRSASVGGDTMADVTGLCAWAVSILRKNAAAPSPSKFDWDEAARRIAEAREARLAAPSPDAAKET